MTIDPTPLRASRDIRLLVGGQTINLIGNQISLAAVPYQVFLITHSSLAVGALSLVQFVTVMCCYLLGGSLADIVDRRRLMLVTQSLLAGTATLLAVAALLGRPPPLVHRRRRLRGRDRGYDNPARRATIPRLVPRDQISNAFSLNQVLTRLGSVAGPSVAGIILSKGGFGTAYAINVGTFLVSLVAVYLISPLPPEGEGAPRHPIAAIGESFAFLRDKPILLSNFVVDLNGQIFGLPKVLFPALATDVFRNGAAGLGLLYAAPGRRCAARCLLTGWCGRVRHQGRAAVICVAIWGAAIAVFGLLTRFFWLGLLMLAVAGAADMFTAVIRNTILQLVTPDRLRGRLSSASMMFTTGGPRLGDADAGAVASLTSPQFSLVFGGLLTMIGCVVVAFAIPVYWNWDAQEALQYTA